MMKWVGVNGNDMKEYGIDANIPSKFQYNFVNENIGTFKGRYLIKN